MNIKIYTDGACAGNPGPGGWAAVIFFENEKKEIFGGEKLTTNNRMEITAAIKAIEYCNERDQKQISLKQIQIYTDSLYLKEGILLQNFLSCICLSVISVLYAFPLFPVSLGRRHS